MQFETNIQYLISVPDWRPEDATPLAGFAPSLCLNAHLVRAANLLPRNVYDPIPDGYAALMARSVSGLNRLDLHPQTPRAIRAMPWPAQVPFAFVLLDASEDASDYAQWLQSCEIAPTIVAKAGGDLTYDQFVFSGVHQRLQAICGKLPSKLDPALVKSVTDAVTSWVNPPNSKTLSYAVEGHGTIAPNEAVLKQLGYTNIVSKPFQKIGADIAPYIEQIVATTKTVLNERAAIETGIFELLSTPTPALNIFLPAMYSPIPVKPPANADHIEKRRFRTALDVLERQSGYGFDATTERQVEAALGDYEKVQRGEAEPSPHPLFRVRQLENVLATEMVGILAADGLSATIRPPHEVNRTRGAVRQFALHYRSDKPTSRKRLLAFRQVRDRITEAIPKELLDLVSETEGDIRIIADAHIEWADVDGLPLSIRKDTFRLPVTPGNAFVGLVTTMPRMTIPTSAFTEILVIDALKPTDPIKGLFKIAFDEFSKQWGKQIATKVVEVASRDDLVNALNAFDGPLVIFDGHGGHENDEPGKLYLRDEALDVWQLRRDVVRVPPIVILSACDTHAADRNHATAANGFLALGARSVLASVFPLQAMTAASFAARLVYRLAAYMGPAINMTGRPMTWTHVVNGMIRMQLLTDFLRHLLDKKLIDEHVYRKVHQDGNMAINGLSRTPFDDVVADLVKRGHAAADMWRELEYATANSSAISYLNMGRPDTIVIDTEERLEKVREIANARDEA